MTTRVGNKFFRRHVRRCETSGQNLFQWSAWKTLLLCTPRLRFCFKTGVRNLRISWTFNKVRVLRNKFGWQVQVPQKISESYELFIHTVFQNIPLWVMKFNALLYFSADNNW